MGIFDLLGDLSSKRSKELGLGGIQSLLGTRRAAQAGAIGDEMMGITNKDSLPGYFNEQTREYVPWYVDLFDGGGLNAAGSVAEQEAAQSVAATGAMPSGAPMAQPGLLQTGLGSQLSDMERANRNRAAQMAPGLGSRFSDIEMANRNRASQMTPGLGSQLSDMEMANRNPASQQAIPASGGNMAINTPAAQGRDQMIADQQMLVKEQAMKNHPNYPEYVDFLNRWNLEPFPGLFEKYLRATGAL